jgi:hypothetical protein
MANVFVFIASANKILATQLLVRRFGTHPMAARAFLETPARELCTVNFEQSERITALRDRYQTRCRTAWRRWTSRVRRAGNRPMYTAWCPRLTPAAYWPGARRSNCWRLRGHFGRFDATCARTGCIRANRRARERRPHVACATQQDYPVMLGGRNRAS